jgi:hypothetical protein
MIRVKDIPQAEWNLLGQGIKYPTGDEWYEEGYGDVLNSAVALWKEANKKQKEEWKEDPSGFWDELDPGLSDDDTDYIKPSYTYMMMEDIIKIEPKFLGPTVKKFFIETIWDPNDDRRDDFSWEARDAWDATAKGSIKSRYLSGHVTRDFKEFVENEGWAKDDEAWMALEIFYDSIP